MFKKFSFVTLVLWIIGWLVAYIVILPPINPQSMAFWLFFGPALILPLFILLQVKVLKNGMKRGRALWPTAILVVGIIIGVAGYFINQPMLSADKYAKRITVISSSFEDDISEVDFDNLPLLDKASSQKVGDRVVGQIPELVSQFVSQEVKGLQDNGVSATLKHFPGQGDTQEDTHRGSVDLETNIDRLRDMEFIPFEAGIEAGADFIMVSHVSVKAVTGQEVPASLSKLMVSDILRDELQYEGIIITDALNMKSITKFYDSGQAALMAVRAGIDMILMPDNMDEAYSEVLEAVKKGSVSESRIEESVRRILTVKLKRGILPLTSELIHGGEE